MKNPYIHSQLNTVLYLRMHTHYKSAYLDALMCAGVIAHPRADDREVDLRLLLLPGMPA